MMKVFLIVKNEPNGKREVVMGKIYNNFWSEWFPKQVFDTYDQADSQLGQLRVDNPKSTFEIFEVDL